ncbi:MAG: hypothetical protein ABFS86_11685 [Planctomycetota bacterium]
MTIVRTAGCLLVLCLLLATVAGSEARVVVADFEDAGILTKTKCTNGKIAIDGDSPGHWLTWTIPAQEKQAWITIKTVPADVREFRRLRFRVRADRKTKVPLSVRLRSDKGCLSKDVPLTGTDWTEVEVLLPEMEIIGTLDPEAVYGCRFLVPPSEGVVLQIDDVELFREPGGYRQTEAEILTEVFGKKRAKKVRAYETEHFRIYTDSRAAGTKFKKAMEPAHDFACRALMVDEMPGRLPIYVFQSRKLLAAYLVRIGHSKEDAEKTEGWSKAAYFATHYRAPMTAETVGNLARSIFKRVHGGAGGDWLSNGAVMYVTHRYAKVDSKEAFAASLEAGDYVPLRELMAARKVWDLAAASGGARSDAAIKRQLGALFQWLQAVPCRDRPGLFHDLARIKSDGAERVAQIEKVFGMTTEKIETAWKKWGE